MSAFRPGQVLRLQSGNAYRLIRRAGDGAEATVWVARGEPDGEQRALKLVESVDAAAFARLVRECQAPAHPNVVRFFEADRVDDCGILVMEFCDGGSLRRSARELRRASDPARRRAILQQVAHGLGAVHASGLVHRDVKPENLLLAGTAVKLGDFGIAADRGSAADAAGTDAYRAP